jgi:hypothetical protein
MSLSAIASDAADWSQFNPRAYLTDYYSDLGAENLALLRFFAESYRALPSGGLLLDFGGGPTIYPLISAATRVAEIHFSDYLETNLREVRRWLSGDATAFDWDPFIRKALEFETGAACSDRDVAQRARRIRACVTRITRCDASRTPPLDAPQGSYDIVLSNFCAESATSDREQWQAYMANIGSLLKPGGALIVSALKGANQYAVGECSFAAVDISEDDLLETLEETGFPRKGIEIRSVPADRPSRDYAGLIMALAHKSSTSKESV